MEESQGQYAHVRYTNLLSQSIEALPKLLELSLNTFIAAAFKHTSRPGPFMVECINDVGQNECRPMVHLGWPFADRVERRERLPVRLQLVHERHAEDGGHEDGK